ncbi:class A sortase [Macrococcus hajekii]|uniref:Class A sortase n=1 Tax=Macrococcus hajekii TaxID=198482 RepID=A0A4R6BMZ7_9STAP|nr:class A sortase [Macrococcus hajekii]TDM03224.1 class A sortase [Macrococcus hajekii]GGA97091.1 class A sortase SrtA [Macrococcus hajekii]
MRIAARLLGVLLILAAVALFFWQDIRAFVTNQVNEKIIQAYQNKEETPKVNELEKWITKTEPEKLKLKDNMLGYLKIPAADINEPLLTGPATQANLKNGVTLVEKDEKLTEQNIAIAGHRVEGAGIRFNYLDRAKKGDIVTLVTREGEKHYKIYDIFNVNPSEVNVLDEKKGKSQELTLITCESYNPETLLFEQRMIVKAQITEAS